LKVGGPEALSMSSNTDAREALTGADTEGHLLTLGRRGLRLVPPPHVRAVMARAKQHVREGTRWTEDEKRNLWPAEERTRLKLLQTDPILKQRYPTRQEGLEFMDRVDYGRQYELIGLAYELTGAILDAWAEMTPGQDRDVAVILFGSVAKGLVKKPDDPDPSNIDLAVIGDFKDGERDILLNAIRPKRDEIGRKIRESVPHIESPESNPGNAGVFVQHTDKLEASAYGQARMYISSNAIAIHDPAGIWRGLETEALKELGRRMQAKEERRLAHASGGSR